MKNRSAVLASLLAAALAASGAFAAQKKGSASPMAASTEVEKELSVYVARFLPFDPETKVTVEKSSEALPGFHAFKIHRKGRYEKLSVDKAVWVSEDGKWFFAGDTAANANPKPVHGAGDLSWLEEKFSSAFRSRVKAQLVPERDAGGVKGVAVSIETGYGPVRLPGYVTPDGRHFLQGVLWDFRMDPRKEKQRRIDLSAGRATGPAGAAVQIVEYADMECGYCKYRGLQMDRLLETNAGIVNARRHYKFFPLWMGHVWSMKAASAGDCLFKLAPGPALFRFKKAVYARQESMTVAGIDELAITTAEAEGVTAADFLSCYLQDDSFARVKKEIEEGYRLGVNSTPTYFVDGTEISWMEDKVMEDFLRTLFPKIKTIDYSK